MFTNYDLVAFCQEVYENSWVYWYGTCGYKTSQSLYSAKAKQYPSHYTASRKSGYMNDIAQGKMCADCVGMIKAFFWKGGDIDGANKYATNHCPDTSANGMIELCKEIGPIGSIPDIPGLVVWKSGHIGVYIGGGYTIEMRGFAYDCVKRKVKDGPWTKWGKLPSSMLTYVDGDMHIVPAEPEQPTLRNGNKGESVRALQDMLIELGYDIGRWGIDGDFGDATEMAVKEFQKAHGLEVDGIVGEKTWAALEKAVKKTEQPAADPKQVVISGGSCYIRSLPNVSGDILGVAKDDEKLEYGGETDAESGWLKVKRNSVEGWVSGKYGKLA